MSKGSKRRPSFVSDKVLEENWRRTFGEIAKKKEAEKLEAQIDKLPVDDEAKEAMKRMASRTSPHTYYED